MHRGPRNQNRTGRTWNHPKVRNIRKYSSVAGIEGLLVLDLGINMAQLAAVREMRIENQGISDKFPRDEEVWLDTEDMFRVKHPLEGLPILNNYTTFIFTIGNYGELG